MQSLNSNHNLYVRRDSDIMWVPPRQYIKRDIIYQQEIFKKWKEMRVPVQNDSKLHMVNNILYPFITYLIGRFWRVDLWLQMQSIFSPHL